MKIYSKLSALGAVLVLSTAFASADSFNLGSWAQNAGANGLPNSPLAVVGATGFAVPNGFTNMNPGGSTQFLQVSNNSVWSLPVGNSSWVSYAQTGPESNPFVTAPNGNYFFNTTFNIGADDPASLAGAIEVLGADMTAFN